MQLLARTVVARHVAVRSKASHTTCRGSNMNPLPLEGCMAPRNASLFQPQDFQTLNFLNLVATAVN